MIVQWMSILDMPILALKATKEKAGMGNVEASDMTTTTRDPKRRVLGRDPSKSRTRNNCINGKANRRECHSTIGRRGLINCTLSITIAKLWSATSIGNSQNEAAQTGVGGTNKSLSNIERIKAIVEWHRSRLEKRVEDSSTSIWWECSVPITKVEKSQEKDFTKWMSTTLMGLEKI